MKLNYFRPWLFLTALVLLVFFAFGCSTNRLNPPEVSLVDVQFGDISLFRTTLTVVTSVRNDNPEPINFSGSLHRLYLNGIDVGKAISKEHFRLGSLESKDVTSKVELSHLTFATRIQELISASSLDYRLDSEFFTNSNSFGGDLLGGRTLKSSNSGTLLQPQSLRKNRGF